MIPGRDVELGSAGRPRTLRCVRTTVRAEPPCGRGRCLQPHLSSSSAGPRSYRLNSARRSMTSRQRTLVSWSPCRYRRSTTVVRWRPVRELVGAQKCGRVRWPGMMRLHPGVLCVAFCVGYSSRLHAWLCARDARRTLRSSCCATNSQSCGGKSTDPNSPTPTGACSQRPRPRSRGRAEPGGWSPPTRCCVGTGAASPGTGPNHSDRRADRRRRLHDHRHRPAAPPLQALRK